MLKIVALILFLSLQAASCADPEPAVFEAPEYSVSAQTGGDAQSVRLTVVASNAASHPIRFTLRTPCTVIVRVFATADRAGTPIRDPATFPGGCKSFSWEITLEKFGVKRWESVVTAQEMLAGVPDVISPLPPGRYYLEVLIEQRAPTRENIRLAAGEIDLTS